VQSIEQIINGGYDSPQFRTQSWGTAFWNSLENRTWYDTIVRHSNISFCQLTIKIERVEHSVYLWEKV
jgi:hypothetical protein